ncbi:transporter [Bacillus atrophaeus]|uniref:GntT/GntP/DsdX family permease n=1 Tax=Bacillus atrophaeus TaxID=1452 RepID=UPI00228328FA|nr:transporter [Bacillus atrophaeus]
MDNCCCPAAVLRVCRGSRTYDCRDGSASDGGEYSQPGIDGLATGAGSVIACHVNDAGFWMVKEFFGLTVKETFQTWTLLTTGLSVTGLGCVLLLAMFL